MRQKQLLFATLLSLFVVQLGYSKQNNIDSGIKSAISSYFAEAFQSPEENIILTIKHLNFPEHFTVPEDKELAVTTTRVKPKLGYQTLWLEVRSDQVVLDRYSITLFVELNVKLVTPSKKIARGELLSRDNLKLEQRRISRNYNQYIRKIEDVIGMEARRMLNSDSIIKKSYVRIPPTVSRGDKVQVQVANGDFIVTIVGEAKTDGMLGEEIPVVIDRTGKRVLGVIHSSELILVALGR